VPDFNNILLNLDRDEVLALLAYISVGLHVSSIAVDEGAPLSPHELNIHLSYINADGADRLTQKLTAAIELSNPSSPA